MSDHIDDTKTNLRLPEETQTCEASPADDTSAIQEALAQEIQNVTADIPKLDLTGISEEEPEPSLPEEASSTGSVSEQESVSSWFLTFMCMNIPIAGWFYLFRLAFNKKNTQRQNFARAYLFYKLIFLAISAVILGILIYVGLDLLDQVLAYMEML